MPFIKPSLPYKYNELEPYIDTETMVVHYEMHHTAYVKNVSALPDNISCNTNLFSLLANLSKNTIFDEKTKRILRNHGGGHYNHSLFWQYMTISSNSNQSQISSMVKETIKRDFRDFMNFKDKFVSEALSVFGSGWCWWVYDTKKCYSFIITTTNQDNPIMEDENLVCLLGLDVWEHAYYLKYQSKRVEYINSWWNVVNWKTVCKIHDELALNKKQVSLLKNGIINFN